MATERFEDVGVKIGGARKDYRNRSLRQDEVESMTAQERKDLVVKTNIWSTPDYHVWKELGMDPLVAVALKVVRDSLAVHPHTSSVSEPPTSDQAKNYVGAIATVRDRLASVKDTEELNKALHELFIEAVHPAPREGRRYEYRWYSSQDPVLGQWGEKFCRILRDTFDIDAPDKPLSSWTLRNLVNRKVRRTQDPWAVLIRSKESKDAAPNSESPALALRRALQPHLQHVTRTGRDWRQGEDKTGEDILSEFGFRAVEYGNWLPQEERQTVVNMAYDSLMDLASVLNLPPSALSLGGKLAIAFGSRGTGGVSAAKAHYEASRNVINLTRLNGAGSMAHEWFHALDWHLGNGTALTTKLQATLARYVKVPESSITAEMSLGQLVRRMLMKRDDIDESKTYYRGRIDQSISCISSFAPSEALRQSLAEELKKRVNIFLEMRSASLSEKWEGQDLSHVWLSQSDPGPELTRVTEALVLNGAMRLSRSGRAAERDNLHILHRTVSRLVPLLTGQAKTLQEVPVVRDNCPEQESNYFKAAVMLDKLTHAKGKKYWATVHEMFARSGAAYVSDCLEARNEHNDYLVYGSKVNDFKGLTYREQSVSSPNPLGLDRQDLAICFDTLVAALQPVLGHSMEETPQP